MTSATLIKAGCNNPDHYTKQPMGWTEVTVVEFAKVHNFGLYGLMGVTREARRLPVDGHACNLTLIWYHDGTGVALATIPEKSGVKRVRFFTFGCVHAWESEKSVCCLRKRTCAKCGAAETIDSSD